MLSSKLRNGPEISKFIPIADLLEIFKETKFDDCLKQFIKLKENNSECTEKIDKKMLAISSSNIHDV